MTTHFRQNQETTEATGISISIPRQPQADTFPQQRTALSLVQPEPRVQCNEWFRAIFMQSLDGILGIAEKGRIFAANPAACRMLQRTEEEICRLGQEALVDIHNTGGTGMVHAWTGHFRGELIMLRADGTPFPADVSSTRFTDDSGQERAVIFFHDVSDRRQAEKTFQESQPLFRSFMNSNPAASYIKDDKGHYVYANPLAAQVFSLNHHEVVGKTDADLWPADTAKKLQRQDTAVFERNIAIQAVESVERENGTHHWLTLKFPIALPDRRLLGGVSMDITERKQAQEEIEWSNKILKQHVSELSDLNQELESFSYSVSHDLRAPLRHIRGFVELLHKHLATTLDDESQHYIDILTKSATRMEQLIDDLLSFSRTAHTDIHTTRVNLTQVIHEVLLDFTAETETRKIIWDIGPLPDVYGDAALLRVVLGNLLGNAVKYTRPRGTPHITISETTTAENERVCFVRDNGVGFDMQYIDKLFGVFQRLHHADEFEGTGIGLATVRRILHRLGGRVWAEGEFDRGATFYFSLPIVQRGAER